MTTETLSAKQRRFCTAVSHLVMFGNSLGYFFSFGDAYRDPRCQYGHPDSTHRYRLAVDLNLFVDDEYITDGSHPAFSTLHDYWDEIGGAPRIESDMNHFSFEHNGVR